VGAVRPWENEEARSKTAFGIETSGTEIILEELAREGRIGIETRNIVSIIY